MSVRRIRPFVLAACLAAVLAPASWASDGLVRPTYAFVLEAEAIDLPWRSGAGPASLDGLSLESRDGLELAWFEARDDALRLVFRSAGDGPHVVAPMRALTPEGREVPLGSTMLTVVPMPPPSPTGLVVTAVVHDGDGVLVRAIRIENHGGQVQRLRSLVFAPDVVARGPVIVRHHAGDDPHPALIPWLDRLRAELAGRLPDARSRPASATETVLRDVLPAGASRDPAELGVRLAPGDAVDLIVTRANFDVDLTDVHVIASPLLRGDDAASDPWTIHLPDAIRIGAGW
jgi:hypothetical protein